MTSGTRLPAPLRSRPYRRYRPDRVRTNQKPYRARAAWWRVWWRAHQPAYQTAPTFRASASRQTAPRTRQEPPEARSAPEAGQTPARSPHRARRPPARMVARAPTGIPARTDVTRRRFAPDAAQNAPGASQKPGTRQEPARSPYRARAVRWRVSWRAHRPAYQPATALRASASRQTPAASAYRTLLRFSTITDPVRIRLRRPGIA